MHASTRVRHIRPRLKTKDVGCSYDIATVPLQGEEGEDHDQAAGEIRGEAKEGADGKEKGAAEESDLS